MEVGKNNSRNTNTHPNHSPALYRTLGQSDLWHPRVNTMWVLIIITEGNWTWRKFKEHMVSHFCTSNPTNVQLWSMYRVGIGWAIFQASSITRNKLNPPSSNGGISIVENSPLPSVIALVFAFPSRLLFLCIMLMRASNIAEVQMSWVSSEV